jgi:hypothetical protein
VARRHHHGSRDDRISYVLSARPGTPTAVVATVGAQHDPETGLGRAIRQATKLDVPLAYATNGTDIVEHFLASGQTRPVVNLAAPVRAWRAYLRLHRLRRVGAQLVPQGFDLSILTGSLPAGLRYYQLAGINRVLGAISRGERRAAITLAPDTGTTVSAAALMAKYANYRLHSDPSRHCGLLYIDDRLPSAGATDPVAAIRRLAESTAADVHIASLGDSFAALSPAQVDLVVINLSHGGQTADPSTWRDVVERFGDAVQVAIVGVPPAGARAVHEYFGNAVYRYTADQGRADGYLPPVGPSVPDPANSAPVGAGLDRAVAAAGSGGSAGSAAGQQDPVAVAVEIRRSIEYTKLAAGQAALASELVSLLKLAKRPGAVGRAAKRRAGQLTELEILAELEDQVGGEAAVLRHIAVLKELLRA